MQRSRLSACVGFRCSPCFLCAGPVFSMSISGPSQCPALLLYSATKASCGFAVCSCSLCSFLASFHPAVRQREPWRCPVLSLFLPHPSLFFPLSAQREPSGVDVHLGDPDELERRGEAEGAHEGEVAEEVGELVPLLQLVRGVVEHALVQVAGLLDLQLVDVAAKAHELPRQLLVLQAHFCLKHKTEGGERRDCWQGHSKFAHRAAPC